MLGFENSKFFLAILKALRKLVEKTRKWTTKLRKKVEFLYLFLLPVFFEKLKNFQMNLLVRLFNSLNHHL